MCPKFCVNSIEGGEQSKNDMWGGSSLCVCRLVNNITRVGRDVKGGEAVH